MDFTDVSSLAFSALVDTGPANTRKKVLPLALDFTILPARPLAFSLAKVALAFDSTLNRPSCA